MLSVRQCLMTCKWRDEAMPTHANRHFSNIRNLLVNNMFEDRLYRMLARTSVTLHDVGDVSLSVSYEHTLPMALEEIDMSVRIAQKEAPDFRLSEEIHKLYHALKALQTCREFLAQERRQQLMVVLENLGFMKIKVNNIGWNSRSRAAIDTEFHILEAFAAEHLAMTFMQSAIAHLSALVPMVLTDAELDTFKLTDHFEPGIRLLKKVEETIFFCVARKPSRYHCTLAALARVLLTAVSGGVTGYLIDERVSTQLEDEAMDCLEELVLPNSVDPVRRIFDNIVGYATKAGFATVLDRESSSENRREHKTMFR